MVFKKWKKLSEKTIYKNKFWTYKVDEFEIEGTRKGEYHYVHSPGSTLVIPITSDQKIILVKQYRYLNDMESIEFPCGSISENLSPKENAQKELREESGYSANKLIYAGRFSPYTGAADEICSVYVGLGLSNHPLPNDDTEEFELLKVTFEEVDSMVSGNIIWDGLSLSAWSITKNQIKELLGNIK